MIDIDYLDTLPKRESFSKYLIRKYKSLYKTKKYEYRNRSYKTDPYILADRILKKYLNKSFNHAFSEYCWKVIDSQYNHVFLEQFYNYNSYCYLRKGYSVPLTDYYIDENFIIREFLDKYKDHKKFPITLESPDFKSIWVRKDIKERNYWKDSYNKPYDIPYYLREYYEEVIISGCTKLFESPTKEFIRWQYESFKAKRKSLREAKKTKSEIVYSFLSKAERELNIK